ncbi:MAG: hypothetical protein D4R73_06690 [Deltaproteobacteria bacterium]|nr:MAG: hypothetical protein D4R73_06690 [Deltaproteobacteria bacterium]
MVVNRRGRVVQEVKSPAKVVNSKVKTGNKPKDELNLSSRLFSIPKKSRILLVSSSHSEQKAPEIISKVLERAELDGCQVVIHAGCSFKIKSKEDEKGVLNPIRENIRKTGVTRYLCEICRCDRHGDIISNNYYIISHDSRRISPAKCLAQQVFKSSERNEAWAFANVLGTLDPKKTAMPNEYPCLLLVCGENNLFNKANRGGGDAIEYNSLSDRVLAALKEIQKKQWCIINPSHVPYKGRQMGEAIMAFHRTCSEDNRVKCVFAVNNQGYREPSEANQTAVWQNGSRTPAQVVYNDRGTCMYRFGLT